jgi:GMP synthase-like glutamine amidotransferase
VKSNKIKDSIFNFDGELPVAQWHEDIVTELPAGATRLASSELCDNQIYRIGTNSYGVQFHPEIDLSIVKTWERDADDAFLDSGKATIEPEFAKMESELARVWKPFVQHWGRLVLEQ